MGDSIATVNLGDMDNNITSITALPAEPQRPPPPSVEAQTYSMDIPKESNKLEQKNYNTNININSQQPIMDSTPISDVMTNNDMMTMDQQQAPQAAMMMAAPLQAPAPTVQVQAAAPSAGQQQGSAKRPMNLTDEQVMALLVGACAVVVSLKPVQDKLGASVPRFLDASGERSVVGLAVTGLLAAAIFHFGKQQVL